MDKHLLVKGLVGKVVTELKKLHAEGKKFSDKEAEFELRDAMVVAALDYKNEIMKLVAPHEMMPFIRHVFSDPQVGKAFANISEGDIAPRAIGAIVMGTTQLAADWIKMLLTRY